MSRVATLIDSVSGELEVALLAEQQAKKRLELFELRRH